MFIMCSEMWNSVTICGPRAEIARFRQRFIVPAPPGNWEGSTLSIDFSSIHYEDTWNFRDWGQEDSNCYSFAFDTSPNFPIVTFERLAELFPALAFDCECIADDDRSGGGHFVEQSGEELRQHLGAAGQESYADVGPAARPCARSGGRAAGRARPSPPSRRSPKAPARQANPPCQRPELRRAHQQHSRQAPFLSAWSRSRTVG